MRYWSSPASNPGLRPGARASTSPIGSPWASTSGSSSSCASRRPGRRPSSGPSPAGRRPVGRREPRPRSSSSSILVLVRHCAPPFRCARRSTFRHTRPRPPRKSSLAGFNLQDRVRCCAPWALRQRIADSLAAFGDVFAQRNLRWLELAWTASILGQWAFLVAVSVYAFGSAARRPSASSCCSVSFPLGSSRRSPACSADRYRRERVLLVTNVARIVLIGAASHRRLSRTRADRRLRAVDRRRHRDDARSGPRRPLSRRRSHERRTSSLRRTPSRARSRASPPSPGLRWRDCCLPWRARESVFAVTAGFVAVSTVFVLLIQVDEPTTTRRELEASTIASEALAGFRRSARTVAARARRALHGPDVRRRRRAGVPRRHRHRLARPRRRQASATSTAAIGIGAFIGGVARALAHRREDGSARHSCSASSSRGRRSSCWASGSRSCSRSSCSR